MMESQNCLKIKKDLKLLVSELLFCKNWLPIQNIQYFADFHENSFASTNDNFKTKTYW